MKVTSSHLAASDTIAIRIPYRLTKRGGRKEMQLPENAPGQNRADNTLIKAIARAFRWKRMLEAGEFASAAEIAVCEGIAPSYVTRILQLTLIAPDIVEAIVEGAQSRELTLTRALAISGQDWNGQMW